MKTLYFTRLFTRGNLKGLTHKDKITFVSKERAIAWVNGIQRVFSDGHLDYKIIDYSFQPSCR